MFALLISATAKYGLDPKAKSYWKNVIVSLRPKYSIKNEGIKIAQPYERLTR